MGRILEFGSSGGYPSERKLGQSEVLDRFFAAYDHCMASALHRKLATGTGNPLRTLLETLKRCIVMAGTTDMYEFDEARVLALVS